MILNYSYVPLGDETINKSSTSSLQAITVEKETVICLNRLQRRKATSKNSLSVLGHSLSASAGSAGTPLITLQSAYCRLIHTISYLTANTGPLVLNAVYRAKTTSKLRSSEGETDDNVYYYFFHSVTKNVHTNDQLAAAVCERRPVVSPDVLSIHYLPDH
ncbi:hypothetical protein J6590_050072 [Homalodisca vitripennis]|nr:hypothetical protein J6590_050072 [Homalodisca vitripennis]